MVTSIILQTPAATSGANGGGSAGGRQGFIPSVVSGEFRNPQDQCHRFLI